jgi:hypothetical protein
MATCLELKYKLADLKAHKNEFDLELSIISQTRNFTRVEEIRDKINSVSSYLLEELAVNKFNLVLRKRIAEKNGFDFVSDFMGEVAIAKKAGSESVDDEITLVNKKGEKISQVYDQIRPNGCGMFTGFRDKELTVLNSMGEEVSEVKINSIEEFKDGLARVKNDEGYFFINTHGQVLFDYFDNATEYSEGVASVTVREGFLNAWYYIDDHGNVAIDKGFRSAQPFSCGFALVTDHDDINPYFINKKGEPFCKGRFSQIWPFSENFAIVVNNGKNNFIDRNGKLLLNENCEVAFDFVNGRARVCNEEYKQWYFIGVDGKKINSELYENAMDYCNGYAQVKQNGKWFLINREGKPISDERFDNVDNFSEGLAMVTKDGKSFFIDEQGVHHLENLFTAGNSFEAGLATVRLRETWRYIDHKGKTVFK